MWSTRALAEVRDWVEDQKLHLAHWFTVDDLMFLFRGGRVSRTKPAGEPDVEHILARGKKPLQQLAGVLQIRQRTSFRWRRCAGARSR